MKYLIVVLAVMLTGCGGSGSKDPFEEAVKLPQTQASAVITPTDPFKDFLSTRK
jgi:hypothetical protein